MNYVVDFLGDYYFDDMALGHKIQNHYFC